MRKYTKEELELLGIQIGCILRYARLKKGLSQQELSLLIESNPTMIGRIERAENITNWEKILVISQQLDVDFCELFQIKDKNTILSIINASCELEEKLTQEKRYYYKFLRKRIG